MEANWISTFLPVVARRRWHASIDARRGPLGVDYTSNRWLSSMKLVRVVECRRISPSIRVSAIPFSLPVPNSVGGVIAVEADDQVFYLLFVCCYYCHREIREMLLPPICRIWTIFISCHLASRMTADRLFRRYADWRVLCPDLENAGDIGQIKCAAECSQRSNCSGFNHFDLTSDWIVCELCYAEYPENITLISPDTQSTAYALAG